MKKIINLKRGWFVIPELIKIPCRMILRFSMFKSKSSIKSVISTLPVYLSAGTVCEELDGFNGSLGYSTKSVLPHNKNGRRLHRLR